MGDSHEHRESNSIGNLGITSSISIQSIVWVAIIFSAIAAVA